MTLALGLGAWLLLGTPFQLPLENTSTTLPTVAGARETHCCKCYLCFHGIFFLGTLFNGMKPEVLDLMSCPGKGCLSELGGGEAGTQPQQHLDSLTSSPPPGRSSTM